MTFRRTLGLAAAVASLGAGAARAEDAPRPTVGERIELLEVMQKDAVVKGDIPGSFRVPGTEVSIRLYGWAELNWIHDFAGDNSDIDYATFAPYVPLDGSPEAEKTNRDYFTARTSRFGIEAATPTRFGALGVKIEGDFNNEPRTGNTAVYGSVGNVYTQQVTNSYGFRIRQAYGQFGGLLAGMTWSTFMDVDNYPETVDFNGPIGATFIRQPVIRYTHATPKLGSFIVALENSVSYVLDDTGTAMASSHSRMPDLVLRWDKGWGWGATSLRGVTQELRVDDGAGLEASTRGWGAAASVLLKVRGGSDLLMAQVTGGSGIGRYLNYIEGAAYDPAADEIVVEEAFGVIAGYTYRPTPWLRMNLVYGMTRNFDNDYTDFAAANGLDTGRFGVNRMVQQGHLGAIFTPIPAVDLGIEGIVGQRETLTGDTGDLIRLNLMARYYIN
jgi:hypothetical protein